MKQTVGNACGTIGLLHALGNITSEVKFGKFSTIKLPQLRFLVHKPLMLRLEELIWLWYKCLCKCLNFGRAYKNNL